MRPSPRRRSGRALAARLTGVLSLAALLLSGCSGDAAPKPQTGLGPGVPALGACRVLTGADIAPSSNATPTVPCSRPHTSVTIDVGSFPAGAVTNKNLSDGDPRQRSPPTVHGGLGEDGRRQPHVPAHLAARTRLLPAQPGRAVEGRAVVPMRPGPRRPGRAAPAEPAGQGGRPARRHGPGEVRACRTTPDFTSGHTVPCDQEHVLRAIGTVPLPGGATFPGQAALRAASAAGCTRVIDRWLHGRINGGDAYQWPDETGWTVLHDHTATCWTVTTR